MVYRHRIACLMAFFLNTDLKSSLLALNKRKLGNCFTKDIFISGLTRLGKTNVVSLLFEKFRLALEMFSVRM